MNKIFSFTHLEGYCHNKIHAPVLYNLSKIYFNSYQYLKAIPYIHKVQHLHNFEAYEDIPPYIRLENTISKYIKSSKYLSTSINSIYKYLLKGEFNSIIKMQKSISYWYRFENHNIINECSKIIGLKALVITDKLKQFDYTYYTFSFLFDFWGLTSRNKDFADTDIENYQCNYTEFIESLSLFNPFKQQVIIIDNILARNKPNILNVPQIFYEFLFRKSKYNDYVKNSFPIIIDPQYSKTYNFYSEIVFSFCNGFIPVYPIFTLPISSSVIFQFELSVYISKKSLKNNETIKSLKMYLNKLTDKANSNKKSILNEMQIIFNDNNMEVDEGFCFYVVITEFEYIDEMVSYPIIYLQNSIPNYNAIQLNLF